MSSDTLVGLVFCFAQHEVKMWKVCFMPTVAQASGWSLWGTVLVGSGCSSLIRPSNNHPHDSCRNWILQKKVFGQWENGEWIKNQYSKTEINLSLENLPYNLTEVSSIAFYCFVLSVKKKTNLGIKIPLRTTTQVNANPKVLVTMLDCGCRTNLACFLLCFL